MKRFIVMLALCLAAVPAMRAQDGTVIIPKPFTVTTDTEVLSEQDKREILLRLQELELLRKQLELQTAYIAKDKEQDDRERALAAKELELAKQATVAAQADAKLWQDKFEAYKAAYESVSHKGGVGCFFKHLFTLWLARCA